MGNSSNKDEPPEPELSKEDLEALLKRRAAVAKEILLTEKSYVTSLDVLVKVYKQPLLDADAAGKPIIPKEDIIKLFSNVEELIIVNKKLHLQLDERLVDWDPAKHLLADIFLARAESLRSYTEYVNNYNAAIKTLSKYSAKKSFKTFLQQQFAKVREIRSRCESFFEVVSAADLRCLSQPESLGMEIQSYLIMPIQRIPRYCLLLQEFLKATRRKHKDYTNVQRALQAVKEVADYVNEQKREFELLEKIYDIQEQVNSKFDLVCEHRKLVTEAEVAGPKSAKYKYFIFNDSLLIAAEISGLTSLIEIWRKKHPFEVVLFDSLRRIEVLDEPDTAASWIVTIRAEATDLVLHFESESAKQQFISEFYRLRARAHRLPPLIKKEKGMDSPATMSPSGSSDSVQTPTAARPRTDSFLNKLLK